MKAAAASSNHAPSFTESNAFIAPPRPHLKHAKTMPAGNIGESFTSMSNPPSPDRNSLIDLDEALEIEIPDLSRPSTSHSATNSAVTDMTSRDPFDLEEQLQLSKENSRTSLHMKSQSEPTTNFLDSKAAGNGSRDYGSDLEASHNRSLSGSSSINRTTDRDRSTSAPRGPARYRQRRPTALQRHWAEKHKGPGSGDTTMTTSRTGSFDSTVSDNAAAHTYNFNFLDSFGDADEETTLKPGTKNSSISSAFGRPPSPSSSMTEVGVPYEVNSAVYLPGAPREMLYEELDKVLEDLVKQADKAKRMMMYYGGFTQEDVDAFKAEMEENYSGAYVSK
jgi:hypothetical protein